jgi:hypothetical protein
MKIAGMMLMTGMMLAAGCGGDDGVEIATTPLAGTINGEAWTFKSGETDAFLSEGDDNFFAELYGEDVEACGFGGGGGSHILGAVPKVAGEYDLSLALNVTFSYGDSENLVATEGRIVVDDVSATELHGAMHAIYDDANEVDGTFTLTICPDDPQ